MKRNDVGSSVKYDRHTDEGYEQELKSLLFKQSSKNKGRGVSSGSGSHQGFGSYHHSRRTEHIERIVLETDTLAGLALLYNTTVAEIKKLNHIYTEHELHARRTIKVPSRGILINVDDQVVASTSSNYGRGLPSTSSHSINISPGLIFEDTSGSQSEINANELMTVYLNTKDNFLQELREKADVVAANSPILNGSNDETSDQPQLVRRKGSTLKWWHLLVPCLGFIILFPILLFLFQEHIFEHENSNHSAVSNQTDVSSSRSPLDISKQSLSSSQHSAVKRFEAEYDS